MERAGKRFVVLRRGFWLKRRYFDFWHGYGFNLPVVSSGEVGNNVENGHIGFEFDIWWMGVFLRLLYISYVCLEKRFFRGFFVSDVVKWVVWKSKWRRSAWRVLRGMFYLVVVLGIEWCKAIPRFCIRVPVVYVRSRERLWELGSFCH